MFCLSSANGCFKVIVSKTRTVAEWWAKLFSPSYRQWRELFCHFVTKPNLSDCIIFLFFLEICTVYCLKISLSLKKRMFPMKLELYNEKSDLQQSFWFSFIAVHLLPFGHSVMLCMRNLFLKGDSSVFVFSFLFFSPKLNFSTRMMMFCHFSQFPPERFLYLNVGLISLDVWLVDKIYFIFNFFELCFYLHLNKVWQTCDMILGKPWLSMKINSVKKQELRWTLILMHFFLFSVG